jgi:transcriptional regulator with XRE-family HTH domain
VQEKNVLKAEQFGDRLRFLRNCLGITQTEMARLLGNKSHTSLALYEGNFQKPNHSKLEKLSMIGLTTVDWLLNGKVDIGVCEKIKSTLRRIGKESDVAKTLGVTIEYLHAIRDKRIAPSDVFILHLCNMYGLNKYEVLAGTFPLQTASPTLRNSKEDYELQRTHAFETSLSKLGLLEVWYNLRDEIFKDPKAVERIYSFIKDKTTQEQINEKIKYYEGQIDMLRGMLKEKAIEAGTLNLEKGKLASKIDELQRHLNKALNA